jgi:hypothetical protein
MVKRDVKMDSYMGIREEQDLSEYKLFDRELEDISRFVPRPPEPEEARPEKRERVIRERSLAGTAFLGDDEIEPLKRASPQIVGSLFDRVEFLRQRIAEIQDSIGTREEMHSRMMSEIDADIAEKQQIETSLVDMDEKRNFKLDISLLRREKRHESVQFWRDMVELKAELRELMEQFETESKIVGIFKDLKGGAAESEDSGKDAGERVEGKPVGEKGEERG